jgi:hypothetical protein
MVTHPSLNPHSPDRIHRCCFQYLDPRSTPTSLRLEKRKNENEG